MNKQQRQLEQKLRYRRTTGGKNWWKRNLHSPRMVIANHKLGGSTQMAILRSGAAYIVLDCVWVRYYGRLAA